MQVFVIQVNGSAIAIRRVVYHCRDGDEVRQVKFSALESIYRGVCGPGELLRLEIVQVTVSIFLQTGGPGLNA